MFKLFQPTYGLICIYFLLILNTNAQQKKKEKNKDTTKLRNTTKKVNSTVTTTNYDNSTLNSTEAPRCGLCPTFFQKVCGFDNSTNSTFIFDNECILKMYNCKRKTEFVRVNYEKCLFFGNFAYVRGLKNEDYDYGDHVTVKYVKKNPDFLK